jgi:flagellar biosynthetic protein FlhB
VAGALEKTERATPKKRKDVRGRGHVVQSRELNSALVLIGCIIALYVFYPYMLKVLSNSITCAIEQSIEEDLFTISGIQRVFADGVVSFIKAAAPPAVAAAALGLFASYAQVGFLLTQKPLKPDLNRLNPIEGIKRVFSRRSLVQLLKSIIKVAVIGYIMFFYILERFSDISCLLDMDLGEIVRYIGKAVVGIGLRAGGVLMALAVLDYCYQRLEFNRSIMMTKQELKEEYKQTEGDPRLKSKIRERQRLLSTRRMMADVPKADVVISNPTHLAVAVKYDPEKAKAPYVLAKGKGLIAERIKRIAAQHHVTVVENKGLAKSLYQSVDIGEMIPPELYQAVAEVLAFVYSLDKKGL